MKTEPEKAAHEKETPKLNVELEFPRIMEFKSHGEMFDFVNTIKQTFNKQLYYEYLGYYIHTHRFVFMVFPIIVNYKDLTKKDKEAAIARSWYGDKLEKLYKV